MDQARPDLGGPDGRWPADPPADPESQGGLRRRDLRARGPGLSLAPTSLLQKSASAQNPPHQRLKALELREIQPPESATGPLGLARRQHWTLDSAVDTFATGSYAGSKSPRGATVPRPRTGSHASSRAVDSPTIAHFPIVPEPRTLAAPPAAYFPVVPPKSGPTMIFHERQSSERGHGYQRRIYWSRPVLPIEEGMAVRVGAAFNHFGICNRLGSEAESVGSGGSGSMIALAPSPSGSRTLTAGSSRSGGSCSLSWARSCQWE